MLNLLLNLSSELLVSVIILLFLKFLFGIYIFASQGSVKIVNFVFYLLEKINQNSDLDLLLQNNVLLNIVL